MSDKLKIVIMVVFYIVVAVGSIAAARHYTHVPRTPAKDQSLGPPYCTFPSSWGDIRAVSCADGQCVVCFKDRCTDIKMGGCWVRYD